MTANLNNWRRLPMNDCLCGCGTKVAKSYSKGHGRRRSVIERLTEKAVPVGGCLIWTGAASPNGYGRIGLGSKVLQVHRLAYELSFGRIPEGLHVDHLCRNSLCINPSHLDAVTQAENNHRTSLTASEHLLMNGNRDHMEVGRDE